MSYPPPVQAIQYSVPPSQGRPGILTAIGIISIIVALLSGLVSLSTGMQAVGLYMLSQGTGAFAPPPPPTVVSPQQPSVVSTQPTTATAVSYSMTWSASAPGTPTGGTIATTTPAAAALTPAEVQTVIQKIQAVGGNGLNPAQVATLTAELQNPNQDLVLPGTAWSAVNSVTPDGQGGVAIGLSGGFIGLNAQGGVNTKFSNSGPMTSIGALIGVWPSFLTGLDALLSLVLAVLLLVAGIMVLSQSPRALRLHQFYAWAKIPVAILGGIGMAWLYSSMMTAFTPGGAPAVPGMNSVWIIWAAVMALISCAYPVALLITLRTRTVRAYYNSIVAG